MADAFYPDGSPIPENKLSEAISQGQARWRKGETVSFSAPTGERYDVPAEQAWDAIGRGWAPESGAEEKLRDYKADAGVGSALQAFGESALSTATLGVSDVFLGDEDSRLAREANPFAAGVGEVAGLITPLGVEAALARGGARGVAGIGLRAATAPTRTVSAVSRAAGGFVERALPEATTLGGHALRSAARYGTEGAIEGATFSAGRELSRQALGEEQLSVEKILSAAGEGALFGGGVGAGVGGIGKVLGAGFAKASTARSGGALGSFVEKKAVTAAGALGGDLNKITTRHGAERLSRIGRELLDQDLITATDSVAQRASKINAAKDAAGEQIGGLYKGLDDAGAAFESTGLKQRLADYLGKLRSEGVGPDIRLARQIERDWTESLTSSTSFEKMHKALRRLDEEIYAESGAVRKTVLEKLRGEVKDSIREEVARVAPDEALRLQRLDESFSDLSTIGKIATKRSGQIAGNRSISLTDTIAGVAGLAVGGPGGLALALANKALRSERTDAALAVALDKMRKHTDDQALAISSAVQKSARSGAQKVTYELPPKAAALALDFAERAEAPRQFATNPTLASARIERVTAPLSEADPVLARRAASTLADDLAWLSSRVPKGTTTDMVAALTGTQAAARVPRSQAASYTRTAKALADPVSALKDLERGVLHPETIDVLRERRPRLHEAAQREIVSAAVTLHQRGERPGYTWRVQASRITGVPLDVTMQPAFIRMAQGVWDEMREDEQAPEQQPPRRVTPNRIRDRVGKQNRTGSEEIEGNEL